MIRTLDPVGWTIVALVALAAIAALITLL